MRAGAAGAVQEHSPGPVAARALHCSAGRSPRAEPRCGGSNQDSTMQLEEGGRGCGCHTATLPQRRGCNISGGHPEHSTLSTAPFAQHPQHSTLSTAPSAQHPEHSTLSTAPLAQYPEHSTLSTAPLAQHPGCHPVPG
eukprot:359740-Chlamydomonas_euryale.AAC.16